MYSKLILVFLATAVALTGCERFMRGHKAPEMVEAKNEKVKCLEQLPAKAGEYLQDNLSSAGVGEMAECLKVSLIEFQRFTPRTRTEDYSADELRNFFNTYFLVENKISERMMDSLMKLKVLFFGGSSDYLTPKEIQQMHDYLGLLNVEGVRMLGHWKVLLFQAPRGGVAESELQESKQLVIKSFGNLTRNMKFVNSSYEWDDLQILLEEVSLFLGPQARLDSLIRWFPLVDAVRATFLGDRRRLATAKDLQETISWVTEAYYLALRYNYFIRGLALEKPSEINELIKFIDISLKLVRTSPQLDQTHFLATKDLDRLVDEFWGLDLVKTKISASLAKDSYKQAVLKILQRGAGRTTDGSQLTDIRAENISDLIFEYNVWKLSQRFINNTFAKALVIPAMDFRSALEKFNFKDEVSKIKTSDKEIPELRQSWTDYVEINSSDTQMVWNDNLHLLVEKWRQPAVNFKGASFSNLIRSLTRTAFIGYRTRQEQRLWKDSIEVNRFVDFEKDFHDLGVSISLLDSRQKESPARRTFTEANFFPPSANGNNKMEATELYEVLHLMISGGRFVVNDAMLIAARTMDCLLPKIDLFDRPVMRRECATDILQNKLEIYNNLPGMKIYLERLGAQRPEYIRILVNMVKSPLVPVDEIDYSELRMALTINHYVESLMVKFDKDGNGILDYNEISTSMYRFGDLIGELATRAGVELDAEGRTKIFAYLLVNGNVPTTKMEKAGYLFFDAKKARVNRTQILNAIGILKQRVQH